GDRHAAGRKLERLLQRVDDLGAARMADRTGEVGDANVLRAQKCVGYRANVGTHQSGNVTRKQHAKAVFLDAPAHYVKRIGPGVLAGGPESRSKTIGRNQSGGRAVAEQGRGDHITLRIVAVAEGEGAEFDDEIEHPAAGQ